jgi:hypothetical protein
MRPPHIVDVVQEKLRRARAGSVAVDEPVAEAAPRYSLLDFTKYRMPKYKPSRVHRHIAEQLERVERGEIDRLMLCVAPRHGKSELASRSFPAWCLGRDPSRKFIAASSSSDLARDVGRDIRNVIAGEGYRLIYPGVSLEADSKSAGRWATAQGGQWYSIGAGGDILGRGADLMMIDDAFGSMAAAQSSVRDSIWRWYLGTLYNRLEPNGAIVIIASRLHEDDLQGRLIAKMKSGDSDVDQWTIVELPAIAEDNDLIGRELARRYGLSVFRFLRLSASGPTCSGGTGARFAPATIALQSRRSWTWTPIGLSWRRRRRTRVLATLRPGPSDLTWSPTVP